MVITCNWWCQNGLLCGKARYLSLNLEYSHIPKIDIFWLKMAFLTIKSLFMFLAKMALLDFRGLNLRTKLSFEARENPINDNSLRDRD